jgi:hypothetical protein
MLTNMSAASRLFHFDIFGVKGREMLGPLVAVLLVGVNSHEL